MVEYYTVRKKTSPDKRGITVAIENGRLTVFAGTRANAVDHGITLGEEDNLQVSKGYCFERINEEQAVKNGEDYLNHWRFIRSHL